MFPCLRVDLGGPSNLFVGAIRSSAVQGTSTDRQSGAMRRHVLSFAKNVKSRKGRFA